MNFPIFQRQRIEEENRKKRQASSMIVAHNDGRPSSGRKGREESRPILKTDSSSKSSNSPVSYGKLKEWKSEEILTKLDPVDLCLEQS